MIEMSESKATHPRRIRDINYKNDNSFRKIAICPKEEDIYIKGLPYISRNITKGKYKSVDHYLDIQFRLLREDFVRPLRNGIHQYLNAIKEKKPFNKINDIRVYTNVRIGDCPQNDRVYEAFFDVSKLDSIHWQNSKRLIYGSLLCISADDFKSFCFGTVTGERDVIKLAKGEFELQFETADYEEVLIAFPLTIIESQVYYEAYRHNLLALKLFNHKNFPFKDYIINVCKQIKINSYITWKTAYDFSQLITLNSNKESDKSYKRVNVMNDNEWPNHEMMGFDESQFEAFKFALKEQFVLIQGPPGTGKTYLGLKIVRTLLCNKHIWNRVNEPQFVSGFKVSNKSPILVVCYTNHALDQFLEGMLPFCESIIRIGGRCKSEALNKYTFKYLKETKIESSTSVLNSIQKLIIESKFQLLSCSSDLLNLKLLYDIKKESWLKTQMKSLKDNYSTYLKEALLKWLMSAILESQELSIDSDEDSTDPTDLSPLGVRHKSEYKVFNEIGLHFENFSLKGTAHSEQQSIDQMNGEFDVDEQELKNIIENRLDDELNYSRNDYKTNNFNTNLNVVIHNNSESFSRIFTKKQLNSFNIELKSKLSSTDVMSKSEVMEVTDVSHLSQSDRWRLYRYWIQTYSRYLISNIKEYEKKYSEESKRFQKIEHESNLSIVMNYNPDIIGMTTTGAAKYRYIITEVKPRIVVIEEAAEVIESHVITSLTDSTEHLILIGDHKQLRPKPAVYFLAKTLGLDVSLFERMIRNGLPFHQLKLQHRMRPCISALLVPHIYQELNDHSSVQCYENIKGITKNMYFLCHNRNEESTDETTSKMNRFEAELIVRFCKHLIFQDYETSKITILTTYSAQLFLIKEILRKEITKCDPLKGVKANCLDSFQGEENDIILISFVRSNDRKDIGFLKVSNRINVALSRAKKGLYCFGDFEFLSENSQLWNNIRNYLLSRESIGSQLELYCQKHPNIKTMVSQVTDFDHFPYGGCREPCGEALNCGHVCHLSCHSINHNKLKCEARCEKIVCTSNHKCPDTCHYPNECSPCFEKVDKYLQKCGHTVNEICSGNSFCTQMVEKTVPKCHHKITEMCSSNLYCYHLCNRLLSCGHKCKLKCGDECDDNSCLEIIEKTIESCGHKISEKCCGDSFCYNLCERSLICGHKCQLKCGQLCDSKPCDIELEKLDQRCGHYVKMKCSQMSSKILCRNPCEKRLVCGHKCPKLCHQKCFREDILKGIKCQQKCTKVCPQKHQCLESCHFGRECKPCFVRVKKTFALCGHHIVVNCSTNITSLKCQSFCEQKILQCSHRCFSKMS